MSLSSKEGQNNFDICMQEFGDMEQLFVFLGDNPTLTIDANLQSTTQLIINNAGVGNETVKRFYKTNGLTVNNDQGDGLPPIEAGDFNNDFNNDFS